MSATKIAIHAHVFYPVLWPELAKCIRNFNPYQADIFLTYPDTLPDSFGETLHRDFPNATIRRLENRGYDIAPFIDTINRIDLDRYDLVVKLHTKRNRRAIVKFMPYWGGMWRRKLLAFCATPQAVKRTLSVFERYPKVGAIGHGDLIMHMDDELTRRPNPIPPEQNYAFVAGTMFAVRAHLLKRLQSEVTFSDFPLMQGRANSELAWTWERRLGQIVKEDGLSIFGHPSCSLYSLALSNICKFAYSLYVRIR